MNSKNWLLIGCLVLLPCLTTKSWAQTGKQSQNYQIKSIDPDPALKEKSKTQEFYSGKLIRENIRYDDGSSLIREFRRADQSLLSELRMLKGGRCETCFYRDDGKTLEKIICLQGGDVETTTYRSDGKTVWTKCIDTVKLRSTQYFDEKGKHRLTRELPKSSLKMHVTVFDDKGKVAYKQTWVSGIRSYVLTELVEPIGNGQSRVLILRGTRVTGVKYLDKDGTVTKTGDGGEVQTQPDSKRLKEYNRKDDPSIPKASPRGIRFDARPGGGTIRR